MENFPLETAQGAFTPAPFSKWSIFYINSWVLPSTINPDAQYFVMKYPLHNQSIPPITH